MSTERFSRRLFDSALVHKALKDGDFRARLLADPTAVYAEELAAALPGKKIPDGVEIRIATEQESVFYVVLPCLPAQINLSDKTLRLVAEHERTHRNPCWGLGDPPE